MSSAVTIQTRTITGAQSGPHLLITGGVHGDEFEPMVAIRRLMNAIDPASLSGRVTLAPVVNEAAFRRGTRCAADGLDLARVCPGDANGSITRRTAHALSRLIRTADYYIDLHTGGTTMSVAPMAGYKLHTDAAIRDAQRAMARAFNLPIVWGTDASLEGRSLSVARDAGIPAIYAEYHGAAACDPAGIRAYVDGCLNVMARLDMLDRPTPPVAIQYEIDDHRPSAGHMQICNPSPTAGFFEPAVELGQTVSVGEVLGTVSDVLGEDSAAVVSQQRGIVLVLRTFCRVERGDALAVILETDLQHQRA